MPDPVAVVRCRRCRKVLTGAIGDGYCGVCHYYVCTDPRCKAWGMQR